MPTTIESSIPPGYRKVKPGREILEGDLLWNFANMKWQAAGDLDIQSTISRVSYVIRKVTAPAQEQPQPIPSSYGGW